VAVVAGTVSGGFGKALGVAVLVGVVKSGPVAWVVGAVGGLVMATAGWWLGRERLSRGIKQVSLPGAVARAVLWPGRLDRLLAEGRERCRTSVREAVDRSLEPLTPQIATQIWQRLKPMLGEQQRQALRHPTPRSC